MGYLLGRIWMSPSQTTQSFPLAKTRISHVPWPVAVLLVSYEELFVFCIDNWPRFSLERSFKLSNAVYTLWLHVNTLCILSSSPVATTAMFLLSLMQVGISSIRLWGTRILAIDVTPWSGLHGIPDSSVICSFYPEFGSVQDEMLDESVSLLVGCDRNKFHEFYFQLLF